MPLYLAHGALGNWDEIIFAGVAVIFLVMMGISWFRSANMEFDDDDAETPASDSPDTFRLE